jgi:hypothetical protein
MPRLPRLLSQSINQLSIQTLQESDSTKPTIGMAAAAAPQPPSVPAGWTPEWSIEYKTW